MLLVELMTDLKDHKKGDQIRATADELKEAGLKPGEGYRPLGTYGAGYTSDLAPEQKTDLPDANNRGVTSPPSRGGKKPKK